LIMEDVALKANTNCGVDRVLAWNAASAEAFEQRGSLAKVIVHPSHVGSVVCKRPLPIDLSGLRVLILPPEWVGLSFASRPDCFERDLIDAFQVLHQLDIKAVHVKCHNSVKEVLDAKYAMLAAIQPYSQLAVSIIEGQVPTQQLFAQFDLTIIIGLTTGILEASRSATPLICFRTLMHKCAVFDDCALPQADTSYELMQCIRNYDVNAVDIQCQLLGESLRAGMHPFSVTPKNGSEG